MKVFLDTNIILDLLLERDGYKDSALIFQMQDEGKLQICVSLLTMVNVAYVYKKTVGNSMAVANLKYLSALVEVLPMSGDQMQQALLMEGKDFEDILQCVCAAEGACDYLITRNDKHFNINKGLAKKMLLPKIMSPSSFVSLLAVREM